LRCTAKKEICAVDRYAEPSSKQGSDASCVAETMMADVESLRIT
jgi:hypothetical protein